MLTFVGDTIEDQQSVTRGKIFEYDSAISLILTIIQIIIALLIALKWANEYFSIKDGFITHSRGIILKKEEKVNILNIDSISHNQSFFGKIFKYGNISIIYGRDQKMLINRIPYPEEFMNDIEYVRTKK